VVCILLDAGKKNIKFLTCLLCFVFCFFEILSFSVLCVGTSFVDHTYICNMAVRERCPKITIKISLVNKSHIIKARSAQ